MNKEDLKIKIVAANAAYRDGKPTIINKSEFDPKHDDFDPYTCWEEADCEYVEEVQFGDINDDDYDEYLCCSAPYEFVCPLYKKRIEQDL